MKLYASNLSYNTGDVELNDLFAPFGEVVSAKVITDRSTGKSRGFGFIEMSSEKEAKAAIDGLSARLVEGRPMAVAIAREKTDSNQFSQNRGSGFKNWK